jgi:hypothetical protein
MMLGRINTNVYSIFCEKFVQCVLGTTWFKNNFTKRYFEEYAGSTDEAWVFLILANNWLLWKEIADDPIIDGKKKTADQLLSKQKYFVEGKGRGKSWNSDGREFFNKMHDFVTADRRKYGRAFDHDFLMRMNGAMDDNNERKKGRRVGKKTNIDDTRRVRCKHDYVPPHAKERVRVGNYDQLQYHGESVNQRSEVNEPIGGVGDVTTFRSVEMYKRND